MEMQTSIMGEQKKKKIPHSSFAASVHTIHINSSQRLKHKWSNARHGHAMHKLLVILILLTVPPAAMSTSDHSNDGKYPTTPIQQSAYTPTSEPTIFTDFKTWVVALASLVVVMGFGVRSCYCNVVCCSILEDVAGGQAAPTPLVTNLASSTTAKMAAPPVTTLGSSKMDPNDQVSIEVEESFEMDPNDQVSIEVEESFESDDGNNSFEE